MTGSSPRRICRLALAASLLIAVGFSHTLLSQSLPTKAQSPTVQSPAVQSPTVQSPAVQSPTAQPATVPLTAGPVNQVQPSAPPHHNLPHNQALIDEPQTIDPTQLTDVLLTPEGFVANPLQVRLPNFRPRFFYFFDPGPNGPTASYQELRELPPSAWLLNEGRYEFDGHQVWSLIVLRTGVGGDKNWIFRYLYEYVRELEVYIEVNGELQNSYHTGALMGFDSRAIEHHDYLFPLEVTDNAEIKIFIGTTDDRTDTSFIILKPQIDYFIADAKSQYPLMLIYGALALMVLYNLILFAIVRHSVYLYYSLSVVAMLLLQFSAQSYGYQFLWRNSPLINELFPSLSLWVFHIFSALFCISALELKKLSRFGYNFFRILILLNIALVCVLLVNPSQAVMGTGYLLGIVNYLSYVLVGVYAWRRGVSYAPYFIAGWLGLSVVRITINIKIIIETYDANMVHWIMLSLLWEALLLSVALGMRVRAIHFAKLKEKEEFFARISHELRTPINGILGSLELLPASGNSPGEQSIRKTLNQSAHRLNELIQDLLTFSRFSGEAVALNKQLHNLKHFINGILGDVSEICAGKGLLFSYAISDSIPTELEFDRSCLGTALRNLINNSCKFCDQGHVVLSVTENSRADGSISLRFSIRDTGAGIAPEKVKFIFQSFRQSGEFYSRSHDGLGLGLSTAAECVRRMGSEICVTSKLGRGSHFYFNLEFNYPAAPIMAPSEKCASLKGKSVLVVEDNPTNLLITEKLLEKEGCVVDSAENGKIGVEKVQQHYYDLVLMDCAMPVMNGFDATERIRALGFTHLPILAVTANAMAGDREKCLAAGMDDYLAKPISGERLINACLNLLNRPRARAAKAYG